MIRIQKTILSVLLLALVLTFATGCAQEQTPYEINDADGYSVSIRYDANGGTFTTNTSVIVDSYNLADLPVNGAGMAEIALLSPDASVRGNDSFSAIKNGHFLAGWYTQRHESTDASGNTVYTYSGLWDFEKSRVEVDPNLSYTAQEPVLTLYAAWVPLFEIQFHDLATGEVLSSYTYDPQIGADLTVPQWDTDTGAIKMYKFPVKSGYTFENAYYDELGTVLVDTQTLVHPGVVDSQTGTCQDNVLKVYLDYQEGEWYHIYNADQFLENASVNGCYEIHADLDFEGKIWPSSMMHGNFGGCIHGNGYTFRNILTEQTNNSKVNSGMFGYLTENAEISDVIFENVTFTIKAGTRVAGATYGLFAGSVSADAKVSGVQIINGNLQIHSNCYFGVDDYVIGLLCGMGNVDIDASDIVCSAVGDNPETIEITVTDGYVTVAPVTE